MDVNIDSDPADPSFLRLAGPSPHLRSARPRVRTGLETVKDNHEAEWRVMPLNLGS
jgi:hypothetical protein